MVYSAYGLAMQSVSLVFAVVALGLLPRGMWIGFAHGEGANTVIDSVDAKGTLTLGGYLDTKQFKGPLLNGDGDKMALVSPIIAVVCAALCIVSQLSAIIANCFWKGGTAGYIASTRRNAILGVCWRCVSFILSSVMAGISCRIYFYSEKADERDTSYQKAQILVLSWAGACVALFISFCFCVSEAYIFCCAACMPPLAPDTPTPVPEVVLVSQPPPLAPTPVAASEATEKTADTETTTHQPKSAPIPEGQDAFTKDETEEEETSKDETSEGETSKDTATN